MQQDSYQLVVDFDAKQFIKRSSNFLYQREDINAHILSIATAPLDQHSPFSGPFWFATVLNQGSEVIACAAHAMPDGLICTSLDPKSAKLIAAAFQSEHGCPSRVSGSPGSVREIIDLFKPEPGLELSNHKSWTIYRIDHAPNPSSPKKGTLKLGTLQDEDLVRRWGKQYDQEKPAFTSIEKFLVRKLRRRELFKWDSSGAKCLITSSGAPRKVMRISSLYTPPEFRGNGYATFAVTSLVSEAIRTGARFVILDAKTDDPVETLYQKIGFVAIGNYFSRYR